MRAISAVFAVIALSGLAALGQVPADEGLYKALHVTYIETPAGYQEIVNVMRTIPEITQVQQDVPARTVAMRGTAAQIAFGEWIFHLLDKPTGNPPGPNEYRLAPNEVARVFYLAQGDSPRDMQEIINITRTIPELVRVVQCQTANAIVLRGTPEQAAMAEWLIQQLDGPAPRAPGVAEYTMPGVRDNAIRVFSLAHALEPVQLDEMVNATRTIVNITRVIIRSRPGAIIVRATPDEAAAAAWLIAQLDQPAVQSAPPSPAAGYRMPGPQNDLARVFYLKHAETLESLQALTSSVRSGTQIKRAVLCRAPKALALRGTDNQIAMAETLIQQLDQ